MHIAVLVMCHTDAARVNRLLDRLTDEEIDVYVHVDMKCKIELNNDKVCLLPDNYRVDVQWAQFSEVEAELNLIRYSHNIKHYDYYLLLSGSDYPLVSMDELKSYLRKNAGCNYLSLGRCRNYNNNGKSTAHDKCNDIAYSPWLLKRYGLPRVIRRAWVAVTGGYHHTFKVFKRSLNPDVKFHYGSQWWCLSGYFIEYLLRYVEENPDFSEFYKKCSTPDESFFHTIFMNSQFADTRKDGLHYIDWSNGGNSPKKLTIGDYEEIMKSKKLFARKIYDEELMDILDDMCRSRMH